RRRGAISGKIRDPTVNVEAQVEESVIPFAPTREGTGSKGAINSTKPGSRSFVCSTKQLAWRKRTADTRWTWRRSFLISYAPLRTALPSLKLTSWRIGIGSSVQSNGSIGSIQKSKTLFAAKEVTLVAKYETETCSGETASSNEGAQFPYRHAK